MAALVAGMILSGCSGSARGIVDRIQPYKIDIRQGNFVTPELIAQLKPGMTREQVRFLLGTPLIADIYHANRWDYVYRFAPSLGEVEQRQFSVFFKDGLLERVSGDGSSAEVTPTAAN